MSSISSTGNNNDLTDQYATQQAEKEKLRDEHEVEMDRLKQSYNSEKADLQDRFETSIQHDKQQTYDNLRNTKRQNTNEEKALTSAGNEHLSQKRKDFQQEEIRINAEGTTKVNAALKKQAAIEEYQRNQSTAADALTRGQHVRTARDIIQDSENKIQGLREEKMAVLEKRKAEHGVAVEQIREHYNQRQNRLLALHDTETQHIQDGVDQQINHARLANAQRLDQFSEKQDDPFYHLNRVKSYFTDQGDHYRLEVKLPEYERKGFHVQVTGHEVQFSGVRSNTDKAEVDPGHEVSTSSYQNFSERYQFTSPVDSKAMQVTQDGEWMIYTIPKYGENHRMGEEIEDRRISKAQLEMTKDTNFGETLPLPTIVKDHGSGMIG